EDARELRFLFSLLRKGGRRKEQEGKADGKGHAPQAQRGPAHVPEKRSITENGHRHLHNAGQGKNVPDRKGEANASTVNSRRWLLEAASAPRPVAHRWAECRAIRGCPP